MLFFISLMLHSSYFPLFLIFASLPIIALILFFSHFPHPNFFSFQPSLSLVPSFVLFVSYLALFFILIPAHLPCIAFLNFLLLFLFVLNMSLHYTTFNHSCIISRLLLLLPFPLNAPPIAPPIPVYPILPSSPIR